jgi:hypothetical protein
VCGCLVVRVVKNRDVRISIRVKEVLVVGQDNTVVLPCLLRYLSVCRPRMSEA